MPKTPLQKVGKESMKKKEPEVQNLIDLPSTSKTPKNQAPARPSLIPTSVEKFGIPLPGMAKTRSQTQALKEMSSFSVRKFDGKGFNVWKSQIEAVMILKDCIDGIRRDRPLANAENWEESNRVAKAILLLALDDDQATLVCHLDTAKQIWDRLLEANQQHSQANKVVMQRQFFDAQMKEGEPVVEFIARVQSIYSSLIQAGVQLSEETLVGRIVAGLTSNYHVFMTNWANSPNLRQTMAELVPRLTAEEALVKRFNGRSGSEVVALVGEKSRFQKRKPAPKKQAKEPSEQSRVKKDKSQIKCFNCGQMGHYMNKCTQPSRSTTENRSSTSKPSEMILVEGLVAEANVAVHEERWILDSGATDHMCYDRNLFQEIQFFKEPKVVKLGDHGLLKAVGSGEIPLIAYVDGEQRCFKLKRVLFVPGIRRKLISLGAALGSGCQGQIESSGIIIKNPDGVTIFRSKRVENLFVAQVSEVVHNEEGIAVNNSEVVSSGQSGEDSNIKLWHERLAHVNYATIASMKKNNAATGLENLEVEKRAKSLDRRVVSCDACVLAKHARTRIPLSTRKRSTEVGQRLHLDICGPVGAESINGSKYFLLLKDEFSNFRFIYFMRSREEAYGFIKNCVLKIKSEAKREVRTIVSDCGSEFTSKRTQAFLEERQITHEKSIPFCPQQNGLIERDNRTIMEAARALLFHRGLPEKLWAEACNAAVYVLNRVTNSVTGDKTPYELFYGQKPRLDHLRVFGSICFLKAIEKKRSGYQRKVEARSKALIFVGYDRDYSYRIFDPEKNDIYLGRDVIFDETRSLGDGQSSRGYENLDQFLRQHEKIEGDNVDYNEAEDIEGEVCLMQAVSGTGEPKNYDQAMASVDKDKWSAAMSEEIKSQIANKTWLVRDLPPGKRVIKNKWVYSYKRDSEGNVVRFKARLVAKGCSQRHAIDYNETFSPVARYDSIRIILSLVAELDLEVIHFDVKTAFLYGDLEEEIWMEEPRGYETGSGKACLLRKSLYGLKQASRQWNQCFIAFLKKFDLEPLVTDSCVLVKKSKDELLIIAVYVDDGLACSSSEKLLECVIEHLKEKFEITVSEARCFVGLEIARDRPSRRLAISQKLYIRSAIERFELCDAKPADTPMSAYVKLVKDGVADGPSSTSVQVPYQEAIGTLTYLMCCTRPDIAHAVSTLARFSQDPKLPHWRAVKDLLRYLKGTDDLAIVYQGKRELLAYSDADYAACLDTRRSVSGLLVMRGGAPVIWKATKQTTVAESTTEAEFIACSSVSREVVWCRHFIEEMMGERIQRPTNILVDNQSAIRLVKNNQVHSKIKQLDIRMMAVREREERKEVSVEYVPTTTQVADLMTKPLPAKRFKELRNLMGMGLLIMLMTSLVAEGVALRVPVPEYLVPFSELPVKRITIKLADPCAIVGEQADILRNKMIKGNLSITQTSLFTVAGAVRGLCKNVMETRVHPALEELRGCKTKKRQKRSLGAVLGVASTAAGLVTGVTNLVRGVFSVDSGMSKLQAIDDLTKRVNEVTSILVKDRGSADDELEKDLVVVSEAGRQHLDELRSEAEHVPSEIWLIIHTVQELFAGAANIRAIEKDCHLGRLATKEIGEMIENEELKRLDHSDTVLEYLTVADDKDFIEIGYKEKYVVELTMKEAVSLGTAGVVILLVVLMVVVNLKVLKALHACTGRGSKSRYRTTSYQEQRPKPEDRLSIQFL